jgi:hypothetical protein
MPLTPVENLRQMLGERARHDAHLVDSLNTSTRQMRARDSLIDDLERRHGEGEHARRALERRLAESEQGRQEAEDRACRLEGQRREAVARAGRLEDRLRLLEDQLVEQLLSRGSVVRRREVATTSSSLSLHDSETGASNNTPAQQSSSLSLTAGEIGASNDDTLMQILASSPASSSPNPKDTYKYKYDRTEQDTRVASPQVGQEGGRPHVVAAPSPFKTVLAAFPDYDHPALFEARRHGAASSPTRHFGKFLFHPNELDWSCCGCRDQDSTHCCSSASALWRTRSPNPKDGVRDSCSQVHT